MNKTLLILLSVILITSVFAHETGDHEVIEQWEYLFPMIYLDHGEYFSAILVVVFWIGLINGIYTLFMMTFSRIFHEKK